jgi:ketosteroid isomerase-like protein
MYRTLVKRRLRKAFLEELSRGDYPALVRRTAPVVVHNFPGTSVLGGTRTSSAALRAWFKHLFRLFPVLEFEVEEIAVSGWPWRTVAAVRWRNRGRAADGEPYRNAGCEVFEIRWGRATRLDQYLDTKVIHDHLERMASAGIDVADSVPVATGAPED